MTFIGAFLLGWLFGQRSAARRYEDRVENRMAKAVMAPGRGIRLSTVQVKR